jgi:hypothetical protein
MKEHLTQKLVDQLTPQSKRYKVWDSKLSGFFVVVNPTGRKGYWCFTRVRGRGTDYKMGSCGELTLKQAKELGADALIKAFLSRHRVPCKPAKPLRNKVIDYPQVAQKPSLQSSLQSSKRCSI